MSELAKGREWIRLEELIEFFYGKMPNPQGSAAVADFLMRCVQGEFCLSLYFEAEEMFRPGNVVYLYRNVAGIKEPYSQFVTKSDEVCEFDGLFDLSMVGAERIILTNTVRNYLGQEEQKKTFHSFGVVVTLDSQMFQLMQLYDRDPDQLGSKAQVKRANLSFISLLVGKGRWFRQRRKEYLMHVKAQQCAGFLIVPSQEIPESAQVVVRAEHLDKVEYWFASGAPKESKIEQTFTTKERNTLLVLIAALAKEANIDINTRGIAGAVRLLTEQIGAPVSDDTIRNVLKQVPEAVESRQK